jgi:protein SCO1/2
MIKNLSVNNIPPFIKGICDKKEIFPLTLPSPARGEGKYIKTQREIPSPLTGEGEGGGNFVAPAYSWINFKFFLSFLVFLTFCLGIFPPLSMASQGNQPQDPRALEEKNKAYFSDLKVETHEGQEARFYTDLLKDRIVVISFFYTNCPTAQMSLVTLFKLQKMLGEQLGKEIHLLSISVDPERDSLKAVQEYAGKYNPKKGWLFLTGKKENLDAINLKLGNRSLIPESHIQVFLLGNLRTGQWMRLPETARAEAVAEGLRNLQPEK